MTQPPHRAPRSETEPGGVIATARRPAAGAGRLFQMLRPVHLGDADPAGRLRFDALARHLQDVATDDSVDAGLDQGLSWVVRRTAIVVDRWPRYLEEVTYTTFCGGLGSRWAERRTSAMGSEGGHAEAAVLWACVNDATGRLAALPAEFHRVWASTAGGRRVSTRLLHPPPPPGLGGRAWQVRAADADMLGHVNNAIHWAAVEDELARLLPRGIPTAAECEYHLPVELDDVVTLHSLVEASMLRTWIMGSRGLHASALVHITPSASGGRGSAESRTGVDSPF